MRGLSFAEPASAPVRRGGSRQLSPAPLVRHQTSNWGKILECSDLGPMFPQATIDEIIESERSMLVTAKDRYGHYYTHALGVSVFLSRCISAVDLDRMMFGRFHAHMKKHHMLALFSTLRLHKVQAMMDLRQVLEAGASGAFAIANPDQRHFADTDDRGILDPTSVLTKKRYAWLNENYGEKSRWIKATKERINSSAAHANIVSADSVFRVADAGDAVHTPFFDVEDEYFVKGDLWLIASVALTLMDLFYGVNQSRNVIGFQDGFPDIVGRMAKDNDALLAEIKETDRFQKAIKKYGLPEAP